MCPDEFWRPDAPNAPTEDLIETPFDVKGTGVVAPGVVDQPHYHFWCPFHIQSYWKFKTWINYII